jgi:VIT1/CCC1 family predicted Fe2+/Mn2+ transporter
VSRLHTERHLVSRIGWLRAAVLGANDGLVSTASLIVGVAAASASSSEVLISGIAGLVAGAMSMAAGEYVSVSSQSDTEQADLARERSELSSQPAFEHEELALIYVKRGVEPSLARQVADQLMASDALGAHARDELGISEVTTARPVQAALTSAGAFATGAVLPLSLVLISPPSMRRCLFRWCRSRRWYSLACLARSVRGPGRARPQGDVACHVLGRAGDGVDGRH